MLARRIPPDPDDSFFPTSLKEWSALFLGLVVFNGVVTVLSLFDIRRMPHGIKEWGLVLFAIFAAPAITTLILLIWTKLSASSRKSIAIILDRHPRIYAFIFLMLWVMVGSLALKNLFNRARAAPEINHINVHVWFDNLSSILGFASSIITISLFLNMIRKRLSRRLRRKR
jgi:hypothetical protein